MAGNYLTAFLQSIGKKEPFENERSVSFLLINNIAHFMKMAGSEDNVPVSDAIPLEQNNDRSPEAAEIVSREKEAKKVNYRNEKTFKNNKAPPKRSTSINYAPKYVKNAAFVHKGRQTRGGPTNKPELRRKSVDYLYTNNIQSTRIYDLGDKKLLYEEDNALGPAVNGTCVGNRAKNQDNTLPPLTTKVENLTLQTKKYRLQAPKERQRSLSGQSGVKASNEKVPVKNTRSASIDYSNIRGLVKNDSRSSLFGRYSNQNGTQSTTSYDAQVACNSARSAFSRPKTESFCRSNTGLSSLSDTSKHNNNESLTPEEVMLNRIKSRRTLRASNVYSPISVASTEKLRISAKPNISRRRASLPNTGSFYNNLAPETSQSQEFFKALRELKQDTATKSDSRILERKSSPRPSRHEGLHIIEEISHENTQDTAHQKSKDVTEAKDVSETKSITTEQKTVDTLAEAKDGVGNGIISDASKGKNKDDQEDLVAKKREKMSLFDAPEDNPKKVFSRLKDKKQISNTEQNQHFVADSGSIELDVEGPSQCLLLYAASEHEMDYLDNSVIFKNDEDLCDEDFNEKRLILWLMDASTGEEAEAVTRTTPPPSPDPSTQESAIRVVYSGDS